MPAGRRLLEDLDVAPAAIAAGAVALQGIAVGLAGHPAHAARFPDHPSGRTGLGLRRLRFDALLAERLSGNPRIRFFPKTLVHDVNLDPLRLITNVGEISPRFLVVADGLRSGLRQRLGWTRGPRAPHRYAVIGHWQTEQPLDSWVRISVGSGLELYETPVGPQERLAGVLCRHPQMRRFAGRLTPTYRELVTALRPELTSAANLVGEAVAVGPFRYTASTVARNRIFLVGDAAGFVDPISGEGMASGLLQARALVMALGAPEPEAAYRRAHRRLTNDPRKATRLLVHLAGTPARAARGLRGLEKTPAVFPKLMGVLFGYWGFGRITPREWIALLAGR